MQEQIIFEENDFKKFREFLNLDYQAITWQGKYENDFENFWKTFFISGLSLTQVSDRFKYILKKQIAGPLSSWFLWMRDSFLLYAFMNYDLSLLELSRLVDENVSNISCILRHQLVDIYPHLEDEINAEFQVIHVVDKNNFLKFKDFSAKFSQDKIDELHASSLLAGMEVTLYDDWKILLDKMKKDFFSREINLKVLSEKASLKKQLDILRDVLLLIITGAILIFAIKYGNEYYEKYLINQISILESKINWEGQTLTFKSEVDEVVAKVNTAPVAIENFDTDPFKEASIKENSDFNVESEVLLTSWDTLPKNLDGVDSEQSEFEEVNKRGYRDRTYGRTKVFRVLFRTSTPSDVNISLMRLLERYKAKQVDNVKPGTEVPGGNYYNIYIPSINLKEFLAQAVEVDDAIIYESKTTTKRNPPGMNKVFIWVKSI